MIRQKHMNVPGMDSEWCIAPQYWAFLRYRWYILYIFNDMEASEKARWHTLETFLPCLSQGEKRSQGVNGIPGGFIRLAP